MKAIYPVFVGHSNAHGVCCDCVTALLLCRVPPAQLNTLIQMALAHGHDLPPKPQDQFLLQRGARGRPRALQHTWSHSVTPR